MMAEVKKNTPATPDMDAELVQLVQHGQRAAFDVLVRKYQHRIVALIGRYITDWSECQDVAQDTFIRAWRAIGNFRGHAQFYTWLHTIAVNTAKNHLDARKRRPPNDDLEISDTQLMNNNARLQNTDTPERELMREHVEHAVMQALATLPNELRTAITLREIEGLSYQAIAQQMNCPVGTVRSRIFRAREAIDLQLRPLLETDPITRQQRST